MLTIHRSGCVPFYPQSIHPRLSKLACGILSPVWQFRVLVQVGMTKADATKHFQSCDNGTGQKVRDLAEWAI